MWLGITKASVYDEDYKLYKQWTDSQSSIKVVIYLNKQTILSYDCPF